MFKTKRHSLKILLRFNPGASLSFAQGDGRRPQVDAGEQEEEI
jgi:hypothetical protein